MFDGNEFGMMQISIIYADDDSDNLHMTYADDDAVDNAGSG